MPVPEIGYGGILTVTTNAGDAPLNFGDSFKLFNAGAFTGSFITTQLPSLSSGLAWSNSLAINGSVNVVQVPPVANFTGTPTNLFVTQTVTFTDGSTGSITNWVWSFGDGQTVTNNSNASVIHAYAAAGTDTVSLIVSGAGGSSTNTLANYVVVKPKAAIVGVVLTTGGNLVFSGTNGPAGLQYRILTTTDVSLPLAALVCRFGRTCLARTAATTTQIYPGQPDRLLPDGFAIGIARTVDPILCMQPKLVMVDAQTMC